jgi:hypothetical protein
MKISRRKQKAIKKANREAKNYLKGLFLDNKGSKSLRELFHLLVIQLDLNGIIIVSPTLKVNLTSRFGISMETLNKRIVSLIEKGFFVLNTPHSLRLNANQEMFDVEKIISLVHDR